jgi:hypothetical protein
VREHAHARRVVRLEGDGAVVVVPHLGDESLARNDRMREPHGHSADAAHLARPDLGQHGGGHGRHGAHAVQDDPVEPHATGRFVVQVVDTDVTGSVGVPIRLVPVGSHFDLGARRDLGRVRRKAMAGGIDAGLRRRHSAREVDRRELVADQRAAGVVGLEVQDEGRTGRPRADPGERPARAQCRPRLDGRQDADVLLAVEAPVLCVERGRGAEHLPQGGADRNEREDRRGDRAGHGGRRRVVGRRRVRGDPLWRGVELGSVEPSTQHIEIERLRLHWRLEHGLVRWSD